jgi:uncharacterized protein YfaS (alpha-2-macroglobulin family)
MIILFATFTQAQTKNYEALWTTVEQFEVDGLPKSALKIVEDIQKQATKDQNHPQLVKTMLFKSKFALILEEDAQLNIINDFKTTIEKSEFPTKNILESLLANMFWQYFNQNRWQFYNRTETSEKADPSTSSGQVIDFRTWDLHTLFDEIHTYYQKSLQNGLMLQKEPLENYSALLEEHKDSKTYRPTLFDFLNHTALEFYKTNETHITKPSYKFEVDNPDFLANAKTFSNLKIDSKDSTSLQLNALKIYQDLIQFHLKDTSPFALADVNIERLKFVNQHATVNDKETLLLKALNAESEQLKPHEVSGLYDFEVVSIYFQQSQTYQAKTEEEHRWKAKEAMNICKHVISKFPKSKAAEKCEILKSQIEQQTLEITTEDFLPIQKHARLLVRYKNLDTLNFSVYKLSEREFEKFNKIYRKEEQLEFINKLDATKSWDSKLKNEQDYQTHTTEILIPKLNNGRYLAVALTKESEGVFAFGHIQITNMALVDSETQDYEIFQIIDRNNGQPITNAAVELSCFIKHTKVKQDKNFTTNSQGQVKYKKDSDWYKNVTLKVKHGTEIAYFGNYHIGEKEEIEKEEATQKGFLFTDRSIYRPGQTVYFKAIVLESKKGKSNVLANKNIYATLYNANDEDLKELELQTNEYGAVSGEFMLPNNGLNGKYYIELDADDIDIYEEYHFSVEEYKRPKFEAKFNPVTETFKVNDSISITGNALAYAGSNITDAKVVYRVHRTVQYPRWHFWYRPRFSSEAQEITHGETTTDASGDFKINFNALPDQSVDKSSLPIFKYEIIAAVTDLNGETRSATTTVNVGYHALTANLKIPDLLDKTQKNHVLHIDTKNLNDEFAPANGTIKIFKLKSPDAVLRPRPWAAPDYQEFSKEAFKNLFPHDAYNDDEEDLNKWEKGNLVLEKEFNTANSKHVELGNIKKWQSGYYTITLESKDKFGQTVRDEIKTTLYSLKDTSLADKQLFRISTDKDTYAIGETAHITLASAAENLAVTVLVEKNKKIIQTELIKLNANKRVISIPITSNDEGGFDIHYSFAAFNSFEGGTQTISVPYPKTHLEIETLSFRDRLQPGTDETWQFKIKGPYGEKVSAELLASMYDTSLDQFKGHSWKFNPINRSSYKTTIYGRFHKSFGTQNFRVYNTTYHNKYYPSRYYDEWNWFGFSFTNNQWLNRKYLDDLRTRRATEYHDNIKKGYVSGTLYDERGIPIAGASIIVKGTTRSTTSDFDGNFTIKADNHEELVFSYLGYKTFDIKIGSKRRFNISLGEDSAALDEVVVVGYGMQKKQSIVGAVSNMRSDALMNTNDSDLEMALQGNLPGVTAIQGGDAPSSNDMQIFIRGQANWNGSGKPLVLVDGIPTDVDDIDFNNVENMSILKGANGVILITTKAGLKKLTQVQVRKNLQETAFFFPHLKTDEEGNISFSFTAPEALTQWKLQLLAHTKTLESTTKTITTVTQKELMVIPNAPRFLREGDEITISTKIANLTDKKLSGQAILILTDAVSGEDISNKLMDVENRSLSVVEANNVQTNKDTSTSLSAQGFSVDAKGNTQVSWSLSIPDDVQAVQYKIIAKSGDFSDGEQNALPVLSNRMLVTETLPLWIRSNQSKTFTLNKLISTRFNSAQRPTLNNPNSTLKNHKLTLEMTSNPAWYAVQALPYLMEYPYDCNEQTFSRYYANALASHIANSNPRIQEVFNQWASQDALISNLEKNEELKSILIQETPWLRDAQSETEQKKRIALLFDLNKMNNEMQSAFAKLENNQLSSGGWAWFNGGRENRYITQHIITGFGHLSKLGVISTEGGTSHEKSHNQIIPKAIEYLDAQFIKEYKDIRKYDAKIDLNKDHLSYTQLHYLYMRSFFPEIKKSKDLETIIEYYQTQIQKYWLSRSLYSKGLMALISHRNKDKKTAIKVLNSLKENSITSDELGMYWQGNTNSWFWYQAPIETQALVIEAFSEIENDTEIIDNLKIWLLKNKQTNRWKTTKATTDAVYALLLQGSNWLSITDMVDVIIGGQQIEPSKLEDVKLEAGTGYYKTSWNTSEIKPEMGEVTITKKGNGIAWGALYWQYFEDLDKITSAETPLKLKKKLFLKTNTDTGEEISEITPESNLKVGDLVSVRIELRSDRNMEFLHMKDMRASGLEPVNVISKYKWQDGLGYYESTKDASTNFFFDYLPKGVYVFEYDLRVNNAGNMSNGITTIQSMYAPEFSSHSEGVRITAK